MKLHITFGMSLDGVRWSKSEASIGEYTCGPKGLVGFLETHLGLTGESSVAPDRVNQYKAKIAAANVEWCRESFNLDAWGTAKQLLAFRDKLVELGWTPEIGGSKRFEAIAAIEKTDLPLSPGLGDRVRAILGSSRTINADIAFVDDYNLYPPVWKKVFEKFFEKHEQLKVAAQVGHPSVTVVTAPNEVMLAHDFVRYLAAKPEENKSITVIADGDTTLLDELMHRAGLPAIGNSASSVAREALQILPLWIENMWEPFSPGKFVQLLGVQGSPVPALIRRELIPALVESPGIGGEDWNAAWERVAAKAQKFDNPEKMLKLVAELRELFEGERFDPDGDGIPVGILSERLKMLGSCLRSRIASSDEWKVVIAHINQFVELLKGGTSVNRMSVNRMIDTIYGQGLSRANVVREASAWRVVSGPGQILDSVDTLLWWNFVDAGSGGDYWSPSEREALAATGISTDEDASLRRELNSWHNAHIHTAKRIICFTPETKGDEPVAMHPYAVNLEELRKKSGQQGNMKKSDFELFNFETGVWTLADRTMQLVKRTQFSGAKQKMEAAALPSNQILPKSLSVTQLKTFIGCPYRWILEKHVCLKEAEIAQLPSDNQTIGLLAHKVVEILASPEEISNRKPAAARKRAGELFDELLSARYADLMLPENADKRARKRELLMTAVEVLFKEIEDKNLVIEAAEKNLEGIFEGVPFKGSADLVLKDATGKHVVFDFKWSYSKKYAESVRNGLSMQLAFYSWLLSPEDFCVESLYYLFPRQKFIPNRQNNKDAYKLVVDFYQHRRDDIQRGRVDLGGLMGSSEVFPPYTEQEQADLMALEEDALAYMQKSLELGKHRIPWAYQIECDYCTCKALCGLAKPVEKTEEA